MDDDLAVMAGLLTLRDGIYADDLILAAVVRLDLLTVLAEEPGTLDEMCARHGIDRRAGDVLATLLRAAGLLETGDVLHPTQIARDCLVSGAPFDLRPYLASAASRSTCVEQVELLRTGQPAAWSGGGVGAWPNDPAFGEFLTGAEARARLFAPAVVDVIEELPVTALLDLSGTDACAKTLAERDVGVRVTVLEPGDLLAASYPRDHDAHLLTHTLHCWRERDVRRIIARSFDALPPGGWLIEHDTHLHTDKAGPLAVARYSALLLHATEGQCWSEGEIRGFLSDAGFVNIGVRPGGPERTVITAQRPPRRS